MKQINSEFMGLLLCIGSDDNAEELTMHIRILHDPAVPLNSEMEENEFLKLLENQLMTKLNLSGVENITEVFMREHEGEMVLDTDGVNLRDTMVREEVDHTRIYSNHICETLEVLGIEAARNTLLKELRSVIEFDGSYVNYRHLAILCDVMTYAY